MKVLFIIPARGGSKRIPKKNIKSFLGKEIISYPINAALSSRYCSKLVVSTDSEEIMQVANKYGAETPFLRSDKNSDDFATTYDVIDEVCNRTTNIAEFDYICCIYPTAVFVTDVVLDGAFDLVIKNNSDGAVSILEYSHPIQRALCVDQSGNLRSINPEYYDVRSQDLEPTFHDAGQFYIFKLSYAQKEKKLIAGNITPIVIPPARAQDIDTMDDWEMAEIKYKHCFYE
ncbi:pseudaminic acid cytidylyltransferase [Alteromonas sp. LMIT006]|uniref:pseudaminic acid cytidylyltransferase n=1 Tax=Alteromonadaceae TaxID=72275 RepID=UPI0020CA812D|nr:pseudaminic acid cytidylyltransferase [Alteromonas sp. LMIT006]UTP71908.1 pseudaminic acid cytidylyltransferase [Alteromonas sp. LMIT006]